VTSKNASKIILLILGAAIVGGAGYLMGSQSSRMENQIQTIIINFTSPDQWETISLDGSPPYIISIRVKFLYRDVENWPNLYVWPKSFFENNYPFGVFPTQQLIWPFSMYSHSPMHFEGDYIIREGFTVTAHSEITIHLLENPPAEVTLFIK